VDASASALALHYVQQVEQIVLKGDFRWMLCFEFLFPMPGSFRAYLDLFPLYRFQNDGSVLSLVNSPTFTIESSKGDFTQLKFGVNLNVVVLRSLDIVRNVYSFGINFDARGSARSRKGLEVRFSSRP
jgi:hypothetical protein